MNFRAKIQPGFFVALKFKIFSMISKLGLCIFSLAPLKRKAQQLRPLRGRFVNASAVALLSFLYLLNLTQVCHQFHFYFRQQLVALDQNEVIDLYPYNGGYSVMGVDSDSAVGLLGLLLFIDLLRVTNYCTVVKKHSKSLILQHCERSELLLFSK